MSEPECTELALEFQKALLINVCRWWRVWFEALPLDSIYLLLNLPLLIVFHFTHGGLDVIERYHALSLPR
jgi:hypothetical protein